MSAVVAPADHSNAAQRGLLERAFPQWLVKLPSGAHVAVRRCGEHGAAVPLVLLHGISSGAASWLQAARALAPQPVIAWDAPGYGHSTLLEAAAPRAVDYARRLQETLDVMEIDRCIVVGHSLGALIACALAQHDPRRVAGLVLVSPARGYGDDAAASERVRRERLDSLAKLGVAGLAARIDQRLVSAAASEDVREWVRWNAARMNAAGYTQAVEMLAGSTLVAPPSGMPVQVHVGEADVVTTPSACERVARELDGTFAIVPGAGHASLVEQPAAVAAVLAAAARQMQEQTNA